MTLHLSQPKIIAIINVTANTNAYYKPLMILNILCIVIYYSKCYFRRTLGHQRAFTSLFSIKPEDTRVRELQRASKGTTSFLCMLTMKKFTMRDSCLFKHLQAPELFKRGWGTHENHWEIFILK
jgi:hypothetical protein